MSCSCRRRSRLNSLAMVSKVSSTFGLSSASIAASDMEFSRSSSSRSDSGIWPSSPPSSPSPAAAAGLNGVAAGGAEGGDADFAFARQQLDRTHFAQIHAHRIVGALGGLAGLGFRRRLGRDLDEIAAFALLFFGLFLVLVVGFLGLDDVDAHFVHHRQHVLDLLGGHLLGRHDCVELLVSDVAALFGLLDHLLDGRVREIEHRQRRIRSFGTLFLRSLGFLLRGGHPRPDHLGFGLDGLGGRAFGCHAFQSPTARRRGPPLQVPYPMASESPWARIAGIGPSPYPLLIIGPPRSLVYRWAGRPKGGVGHGFYRPASPESRSNLSKLR